MIKRFSVITISIFILLVIICKVALTKEEIYYTDDIINYHTESYPLPPLFLEEIPSNAQVVSFSYYNYWHEQFDYYLELTFDTSEEMESYILQLKNYYSEKLSHIDYWPQQGKIIVDTNPYDSDYTDMFYTIYGTSSSETNRTGYGIKQIGKKLKYECCFGVISYSLEDLTVIQSYTSFWTVTTFEHIPKYFTRFNIPNDREFEKYYYLTYDIK